VTGTAAPKPLVYFFGQGRADGTAAMKDTLGGKGAGLAEMTNLGIPVPPGFTLAADLCNIYLETGGFPPRLKPQLEAALGHLEAATKRQFGGADDPLLVSVRSGAAVSMPGMMETILNLGLNDTTVEALRVRTGNANFAFDSYRRFVQMYGGVVYEVPKRVFDEALDQRKRSAGAARDIDLPWEADPQRDRPHEREHLQGLFDEALRSRRFPVVRIRGSRQERFLAARTAIDALLDHPNS